MSDKTEVSVLQTKQRDYWFDNIKGILMIAVVIGHMIAQFYDVSPVMQYIYNFINTFHMGTFLILTGYLSKRRVDSKDYLSVINKNIVPYIVAQFLLYLLAALVPGGFKASNVTYFSSSEFSFLIPVYQLWYLMAVIIHVLISMWIKPKRRPIVFMIGAVIVTLLCGVGNQVNILRFTKALSFYPFFLLGYLLPKDTMEKIRNKWQFRVAGVLVFVAYALFFTREELTEGIRKVYGLATSYSKAPDVMAGLHPAFGRLFFVLFVPVVAIAFFALVPRCRTIFTKLGQNSLYIFVLHSFFVVAVRCLHYEYKIINHFNTWYLKALYLFGCIAITFFLGSNFVKKIFRPILEPDFDIVNVVGFLCEKYKEKKEYVSQR